jgi:hypothetical protein
VGNEKAAINERQKYLVNKASAQKQCYLQNRKNFKHNDNITPLSSKYACIFSMIFGNKKFFMGEILCVQRGFQ